MVISSLLSHEFLREGKAIKLPNGPGSAQAPDPRPHDVTFLTPRLHSTGTKGHNAEGRLCKELGGLDLGPTPPLWSLHTIPGVLGDLRLCSGSGEKEVQPQSLAEQGVSVGLPGHVTSAWCLTQQ